MRKIKIFIGSSIEELKNDRIEIGNFFRQLNDLYLDNGLYFQLIMCEDYSDAIELDGKQSKYDKEIIDSDLSVFIFYKKVGVYTEHEFEIAYKSFKSELRPKILTVFKCVSETNEIITDVKFFADKLDKELKHYYKTYSNTDSLKLWLIMQIRSMSLDQNMVEFKGGKVLINGETVAIYENAPAFSNYGALTQKKQSLKEITAEYLKQKAEYLSNPEDIDCYLSYSQLAKQKNDLEEEIDNNEKDILTQLQQVYTFAEKGNLSQKQILAYRLIESGKFDQALELLNSKEIFAEASKNEKMIELGECILENAKNALQTNVNEIFQRIETLKIKGITTQNFDEINELFSKACDLSFKHSLDSKIFFEYKNFLYSQNQHANAYAVVERVRERIEKFGSWEEKADLWHSFANLLFDLGKRKESIEYFEKTLKASNALLSLDENENNLHRFAKVNYDFSLILGSSWEVEKSEKYSFEAINHFKKLVEINFKKYVSDLSLAYSQYAWALNVGKKENSVRYYKQAYELIKHYYTDNNATDKEKKRFVLLTDNYVITLIKQTKDFSPNSECRTLFMQGFSVAKQLADNNPQASEQWYANYLQRYGYLLDKYYKEESPEEYYLKSFKIYERYKELSRKRNIFHYALSAVRLAQYYSSILDSRATQYNLIAVNTYETMGNMVEVYSFRNRAQYYYQAGMIYLRELKDYKKCAIALKKSLELYDMLEEKTADDKKWINYMLEDFKDYNLDKYLKDEINE